MRPKEFQTQALDVFEQFLAELKKQQDEAAKRITALEQAGLSASDNDRTTSPKPGRSWAGAVSCPASRRRSVPCQSRLMSGDRTAMAEPYPTSA